MPTLKIDLDIDAFNRLAEIAVRERRPIPLQVEVIVMQAIGLWSPHRGAETVTQADPAEGGKRHAAIHDR
jgi:hypothetical protein